MSEKKTFLGVELSSSKKVNFLVLISIIALLTLIVATPYFYDKKDAIYAPMYIDSSKKHGVLFNINHSLCLTDADGVLINHRRYKDLGIKDVADVKFMNDSLILVQGDGKIKQCSISLTSCMDIGSVSSYRADIFMRIIPSKDEKSFYIVQTNKSKIDKFDKEGKHLYRLNIKEKEMKYPGGGMALTDDTILIADTKHKRVIAIQDKGEGNTSVIWSLSSYSDMKRNSYRKVLAIKLDKASNIWMSNTNKSYEEADILVMDIASIKNYKADINKSTSIEVVDGHTQRIESKLTKYPSSLAPHRDGMLIADGGTFKVLYIDNSYMPTVFGDSYVQGKLKKLFEEKEYYQNIIDGLYWFFGIGMLLAIMAAIMESPRAIKAAEKKSKKIDYRGSESISEAKKIEPDNEGIIWLLPNKKLAKQIKWLKRLLYVAILFSIYQIINILTISDASNKLLELFTAVPLPIILIYMLYFLDFTKYSIGVDDTHLYIKTPKNKQIMAFFEDVTYSTNQNLFEDNPPPVRIAIDTITLPLIHGNEGMYNNSLFDEEQFNYYIKPKLQHSSKISWQAMLHKQWKGIDFKMKFILALPLILSVVAYGIFFISK